MYLKRGDILILTKKIAALFQYIHVCIQRSNQFEQRVRKIWKMGCNWKQQRAQLTWLLLKGGVFACMITLMKCCTFCQFILRLDVFKSIYIHTKGKFKLSFVLIQWWNCTKCAPYILCCPQKIGMFSKSWRGK